eukprot:535737-Amphidinium_carterae.1
MTNNNWNRGRKNAEYHNAQCTAHNWLRKATKSDLHKRQRSFLFVPISTRMLLYSVLCKYRSMLTLSSGSRQLH